MTTIHSAQPRSRFRFKVFVTAAVATSLVTIAAIGLTTATGGTAIQGTPVKVVSAPAASGQLNLSPADLARWAAATATPAQRTWIVAELQRDFAGVATVSDSRPAVIASSRAGYSAIGFTIKPAVSSGLTGDHFWIIASYADMANGAIGGAMAICSNRLPGWLCRAAGNLLQAWAGGWGSGSNHGVWAGIYWSPPHVTGGRW